MANPSFATITVQPAPGATPIANNATAAKTFANNYYKLNEPTLSMRERMTIAIIGLIHEVTAADYRLKHPNLIQDAMVFTRGISQEFDFFSAIAGATWTLGKATDAALSNDIPTLLGEGRDLANLSEDELKRIFVFLFCQLLT